MLSFACKRYNYKYINRLKLTGKFLPIQMLPGLYLCLSTMFQLDLNGILTEIGVAESSAQL